MGLVYMGSMVPLPLPYSCSVRSGTAVGVRTAVGENVSARRAVLADTSAPPLYRDLIGEEHLPSRLLRDLDRFQWDFATFKVDWALTGPVPWTAPQAAGAGTVPVADGVDGLTRFASQIAMGQVPDEPFALHQQAIFRPTPGTGRPETPVRGLYLASAAAHPGGGVHGAPGANAARAALRPHGLHSLLHRAQRI